MQEGSFMKAYFTVEAACVLPIVLGVYVFLIYGMFYQYDRCLLEQDVALQVLKEQWNAEQQTGELEQYLAFRLEDNVMKIGNGKVHAYALGTVTVPFKELTAWTENDNWKLEASFTSVDVDPAEWIRQRQKIMEGIENVTDRIRKEP